MSDHATDTASPTSSGPGPPIDFEAMQKMMIELCKKTEEMKKGMEVMKKEREELTREKDEFQRKKEEFKSREEEICRKEGADGIVPELEVPQKEHLREKHLTTGANVRTLATQQVEDQILPSLISKFPRTETVHLTGLLDNDSKGLTVVFHAVLPCDEWQYSEHFRVHLRFDHQSLGSMSENCGSASFRKSCEGYVVAVIPITLNIALLQSSQPLCYVYAVYSKLLINNISELEKMPDDIGGGYDDVTIFRRLKVPKEKCFIGGIYHCYDAIVYPGKKPTHLSVMATRYAAALKNEIGTISMESHGKSRRGIPLSERHEVCLKLYLSDDQVIINFGKYSSAVSVEEGVEQLLGILKCLQSCEMYIKAHRRICKQDIGNITKSLQKWLLLKSKFILESSDVKHDFNWLIKGVIIVLCLWKIGEHVLSELKPEEACSILKLLKLSPNLETNECEDYDAFFHVLQQQSRLPVVKGIETLCQVKFNHQSIPVLIEALPLQHFLLLLCKPFANFDLHICLERLNLLPLKDVRAALKKQRIDSMPLYNQLHDVSIMDPYLPVVLVYILPVKDLVNFLNKLPIFLAFCGIAKRLHDFQIQKEYTERLADYEEALITLKEMIETESGTQPELVCPAMITANTMLKISNISNLSQVQLTFELLLQTLQPTTCVELKPLLEYWIQKKDVVGGKQFGGGEGHSKVNSKGLKQELKLWQTLADIHCPDSKKDQWKGIIKIIVYSRVKQLSSISMTALFESIDIHGAESVVIDAVLGVIEEEFHRMDMRLKKRLISPNNGLAPHVVSRQICKHCEKGNITVEDLLCWDNWTIILDTYGNKPLPDEHANALLLSAKKEMERICKAINDCDVLVSEMRMIRDRGMEQMNTLLKIYKTQSSTTSFAFDTSRLKDNSGLVLRLKELEHLETTQKQLFNLYTHMEEFWPCDTLRDLKQEANMELEGKKLKEVVQICPERPDNYSYPCFPTIPIVTPVHKELYTTAVTTDEHDVFLTVCKIKPQDLRYLYTVKKWFTSIKVQCSKIIKDSSDLKLTIQESRELFGGFSESKIASELKTLSKLAGVKIGNEHGTAKAIYVSIQHYQMLIDSEEAANLLSDVAHCFHCECSTILKNFSEQIKGMCKKTTLADCKRNEEELGICSQFKPFWNASKPTKNAMRALTQSLMLLEWLKMYTKDVNDVHKFTDLASCTEVALDSLKYQMLSDLGGVIAMFGPFIYETRCDMKVDDFLEISKRVWKSLDRTTEPVDRVLTTCNEQVKWYDVVMKSHGSMESSTQGHVKIILSCGTYNIGTSNLNSTKYLCVRCDSEDTNAKNCYSAEELQDLNSTLYFMRMSGEVKAKMEHFQKSLATALETGQVLSELQQNGNPRFTGSIFHVKCSADVQVLKDLAKSLRAELQEWKRKVQAMRDNIYELNYFTAKQILRLQVGLFNFKSKCSALQSETIQLLQSVSPNLNGEVLTQALQEARYDIELSDDDHAEGHPSHLIESDISEKKTSKEGQISLEQLRSILQYINKCSDFLHCGRPYKFRTGVPSVIQTTSDKILQTLLSVYMMDATMCLPTLEEVLICGENTTEEESYLFLHRALHDRQHKQVFCLVDPGRLSRKTADISFSTLGRLQLTCKSDYRLVIIITSENHKVMFGQLDFIVSYAQPFSKAECCVYVKNQLANDLRRSTADYRDRAQVYTSNRAGMGKSFQIANLVAEIAHVHHTVISILTPSVTADTIVERIQSVNHLYSPVIFHFDISTEMMFQVDVLLFSFIVLGGLRDSTGQIARFRRSDMAIMEVTATTRCPEMFSLLPNQCVKSPQECVSSPDLAIFMEQSDSVAQTLVRDSSMKVTKGKVLPLQVIYSAWNVADPSWSEISNFIKFLAHQLNCCEKSYYCSDKYSLPGFKEFVTSFVIEMSKDFAASSLRGEVDTKSTMTEGLEKYELHPSRTWMIRPHPYLVFNDDRISLTFVGFKVSTTGDLLDRSGKVLKKGLISKDLLQDLRRYKVDLSEEWEKWSKKYILAKLSTLYGHNSTAEDPDENYVLTVDNFLKMLAILMRFRCDIPVVLMGETGCGKTKLIRFMTRVAKYGHESVQNLFLLKIHGGTTEADIIDIVKKATFQVEQCGLKCDIVVFFDEANTTSYIGLIKEIMCDKRMNGEKVDSRLKFIAACNPYRRHSDEMIKHLERAGLGFHYAESTEKCCSIPLRHLVYRVLDLPQSLRPLVFDFGQLDPEVEGLYISLIVTSHLTSLKDSHAELRKYAKLDLAMTEVLHWCQNYMREQKDECSYVSLRDVVRAMKVFGFFLTFLEHIESDIDRKIENPHKFKDKLRKGKVTRIKRAFALTVNVCYEMRLISRELFIRKLCEQLQQPDYKCLSISKKYAKLQRQIKCSQEVVLENMVIPDLIAKNTALRENVFIMVVCIELRIPLFLIGKPGSSKSLARIIVQTSMIGINAKTEFTRRLKQVQMFSYQCSHISTAETIINVFSDAQSYQKGRDNNTHASVVVLDEIGLAEDSPNLPLKSLHPLLEDGTHEEHEDSEDIDRVGFIGISNWALDPAKMNRGLMVMRPDPDVDELIISAKGICGDMNTPLDKYFRSLAEGYLDVIRNQGREFFGLRDFYSLIKMLHQDCQATSPTPEKFLRAIRQNFDGFGGIDTVQCFNKPLLYGTEHLQREQLDLIRDTLTQQFQSRDHRYLLLMTDNNAAFAIVKSLLANSLDITARDQPTQVMYGSGFPKDKGFVEACRNVNKIKHCMEAGHTLLLLNLESVYESLYDLLNQFYTEYSGRKYVELGLQQRRTKCQVHDDFRIIIIAEEKNVYEKFPTALINRLEKHRVAVETNLEKWQMKVMTKLLSWIDEFSNVNEFKSTDAFVGYHKDVPATVVFEACRFLPEKTRVIKQRKETTDDEDEEMERCLEKIFEYSKRLLLQTAAPDAIIRLDQSKLPPDERERIHRIYFQQQSHSTLGDFLQEQLESGTIEGFFFQITTHSELSTQLMFRNLSAQLEIKSFLLEAFDTEAEFVDAIRNASEDIQKRPLIVLQCSAAITDPNLIAGVKHVLQELYCTPKNCVNFILVIHVPRCMLLSSHIGLQGHPWQSIHIETLWPANDDILLPLLDKPSLLSLINEDLPLRHLLHAALTFMDDTEDRVLMQSRYENVQRLIEIQGADVSFHKVLIQAICKEIKNIERSTTQVGMQSWILKQALNKEVLKRSGTFQASLQKHIRDTLIPILANVIAFTDQYSNLSLLYSTGSSTIICKLWISLFQCTIERTDPRQSKMDNCFECKFPFSWIVNRSMDHLVHVAVKLMGGRIDDPCHLRNELCKLIQKDSLGRALEHEAEGEMNPLVNNFFSDFVSLNHPGLNNHCHQLMCTSLKRLSQSLEEPKGVSLLYWRISGLYAVNYYISSELTWFRLIVGIKPDICSKIQDAYNRIQDTYSTKMILHLCAVEVLLDVMEKDFSMESTVNECLALMYEFQIHLDTMLSLNSKHFIICEHQLRLQSRWSHLKALRLLAEEVVQKERSLFECYGILYKEIDLCPNFSNATTVSATLIAVKKMEYVLFDKCINSDEVACYFQDFFTEIISLNLRENKCVPKEVVDVLLDLIFLDEPPTNVDIPSTNYPTVLYINQDSSSMLKFLIQVVLKQDLKSFEVRLDEYLLMVPHKLKYDRLTLEFIQYIESCTIEIHRTATLDQQLEETIKLCHKDLGQHPVTRRLNSTNLCAVARLRAILALLGDYLGKSTKSEVNTRVSDLTLHVKKLCSDPSITKQSELTTGPLVYLMRQIAKKHSISVLKEVSKKEGLNLILPHYFMPHQKEADVFLMYDKTKLEHLRLNTFALLSGSRNVLKLLTQDRERETSLLFFTVISSLPPCNYSDKAVLELRDTVKGRFGRHSIVQRALPLLDNPNLLRHQHSSNLAQALCLDTIMVHCNAIFSIEGTALLEPFRKLINNPISMKGMYLPTMPQDDITEIVQALSKAHGVPKVYKCPAGHQYVVTECGDPMEKRRCPVQGCNLKIGGKDHVLLSTNKRCDTRKDCTQTGYILGMPNVKMAKAVSERALSPAACTVVRLILHAALIIGASYGKKKEICKLLHQNLQVKTDRLEIFLWNHLEEDFTVLQKALGRSIDDAAMVIHLVLHRIFHAPVGGPPVNLSKKELRASFENDFSTQFVLPILQNLHECLKDAYRKISIIEGDDPLHSVVNELQVQETLIQNMWCYSPTVNIKYLTPIIMQRSVDCHCSALKQLFEMEPAIRATKFIPDIFQLQVYLYERYNFRLDKNEAETMKVKQLLIDTENARQKQLLEKMIEGLRSAWNLVKAKLKDHGRCPVVDENSVDTIDHETPLDYIIPTTVGHGVCTVSLLDFLVCTHNEFINTCHQVITNQNPSLTDAWRRFDVPLHQIQRCHLIDHENHLVPIILANIRCMLKVGMGDRVECDPVSIQRRVINKLVIGKPLIIPRNTEFHYRRDAYCRHQKTLQKVKTDCVQESLSKQAKEDLIKQNWSVPHLKRTIEHLEIALWFLSFGIGDPNQSLKLYITETLHMNPDPGTEFPSHHLKHIISLWMLLNVELGRKLVQEHNQDPFDLDQPCMDQKLNLEQKAQLGAFTKEFDMYTALEIMLEFILTFVKGSNGIIQAEWTIVETIEPALDESEDLAKFVENFPQAIQVGQTVDAWREIVHLHHKAYCN